MPESDAIKLGELLVPAVKLFNSALISQVSPLFPQRKAFLRGCEEQKKQDRRARYQPKQACSVEIKKAMKNALFFPLLISCSLCAAAQEAPQPSQPLYYGQVNANFQVAVPVEGFRTELMEAGIGFGGNLLLQLGRGRPLFGGLEFSYANFDGESVEFTSTQNGFPEDFRLRTRTNLLIGHGILRFKPFTGFFLQPYFDGLVGFKRLYARTTFTQLFDNDEEELLEASIDQSDTAFSFGVGSGLQIRLSHFPELLLDLRCTYYMGSNASFMVRDEAASGPFDDPIEAFEERTAPTSVLLPQIGITLQLSDAGLQ